MERRAKPRKPVLMSGAIEFASSTINCLICDISISGAALEISNPRDIPNRFDLFFKADRHAHSLSRHLAEGGADRCRLRLIPDVRVQGGGHGIGGKIRGDGIGYLAPFTSCAAFSLTAISRSILATRAAKLSRGGFNASLACLACQNQTTSWQNLNVMSVAPFQGACVPCASCNAPPPLTHAFAKS